MKAPAIDTGERRWALQPTLVLLCVPVIMAVLWYFGRSGFFRRELGTVLPETMFTPLYPFLYLCVSSLLLRMILPICLVRFVLRKPLKDFGFVSARRPARTWLPYLSLYLALLPVIVIAGRFPAFRNCYPQFGVSPDGTRLELAVFLAGQVCYLLLFVSGEAFWRGFVLFGLRPHFGHYAILIMTIPYTMQHFGKPFPETMGAVLTGFVLGWLAMRRGDFWPGVALHYAAALTMDLAAILWRGLSF